MLDFPQIEAKILKFWQENKIFDKLRKKNQGKKRWSFLDGPITANNPMGVHHAWGRTYKDLFQRFMAMQGYDQRFQNGFDCQGLWVEVEVEKELGFKNKKDIEKYGIDKFVEKCKERVKKYSAIQTQQSIRLGQWMDWDNSYYTMSDENNYMIWHFLKKCWQSGLLYKGRDSVPWCPRCGTAISQHEILQEEYRLLTHKSVVLKLPIGKEEYLLAWTTTPWSIPGTIALMVNPNFDYVKVEQKDGKYILAKERTTALKGPFKIIEEFKGEKLIGKTFVHPYQDFPALEGQKFPVIPAEEFVTLDIGTGIVTNNPGVGHEDYLAAKKVNLPPVESVDESANFIPGYSWISNKNAKSEQTTEEILKDLQERGFVYDIYDFSHRYPTCWRCKTELIFRSVDEWYIAMDSSLSSKLKKSLRKKLTNIAGKIKWIPEFGLSRELDWLKNMQDWLISKKRYWGLALPIFECECGNFEVIGSKEELKKRAVEGWDKFEGNSPHRPWVDNVKIKCSKCGKLISRIKDVGNPWLDAGIVPFSTFVDPKTKKVSYLADKKYWKEWFPAELICESFPGQFKNWFYSLIVMSTVLENTNPAKTVFGYASVHDENDEEMHKSKGNAIWFDEAVEKIGADPMRWMYSRQNPVDNLRFGYHNAAEIKRKLLTLYNVFTFFNTYVEKKDIKNGKLPVRLRSILDVWVISRFNNLVFSVTKNLNEYNAGAAVLAIEDFFIGDLSLWYVRRSRKRFHEGSEDRAEAVQTLYYVLMNLTKLIAPIMPFFVEEMYQSLKTKEMPESVHLCDWPKAEEKRINKELEVKMAEVRNVVALALAERAVVGIKVRQPLASLKIKNDKLKKGKDLLELLKDEVNVKEIIFDNEIEKEIELDTKITKELGEEGEVREIVRNARDLRKKLGLSPQYIVSGLSSTATVLLISEEELLKEIGAKSFKKVESVEEMDVDVKKEIKLDGKKHYIGIKK